MVPALEGVDMKILLGAALVLLVLYLISGSAITSVISLGEKTGESVGGRKLGYSPFKITFKDQYLCYAFGQGEWVMTDHDTGDDCEGPFIDSVSLCRAMEEVGETRVRLFWEGRVLECS